MFKEKIEVEKLDIGQQLTDLIKKDQHMISLTVARMALKDIEVGRISNAIARLKVDADKIRTTNRELYDFIMNYKE